MQATNKLYRCFTISGFTAWKPTAGPTVLMVPSRAFLRLLHKPVTKMAHASPTDARLHATSFSSTLWLLSYQRMYGHQAHAKAALQHTYAKQGCIQVRPGYDWHPGVPPASRWHGMRNCWTSRHRLRLLAAGPPASFLLSGPSAAAAAALAAALALERSSASLPISPCKE
jgi:hypothetical protein